MNLLALLKKSLTPSRQQHSLKRSQLSLKSSLLLTILILTRTERSAGKNAGLLLRISDLKLKLSLKQDNYQVKKEASLTATLAYSPSLLSNLSS
jgi:hypothetical protein